MMDHKKMREKALAKLKNNYVIIIIALLIYNLIEALFNGTSKLIYNENMNILFNILITGLLYEGLLQIVIKTARGRKTDIMDLFNRTDLFWKSSAITVILTALTVVCGILEYIAGSTLYVFTTYQADINVLLTSFMILAGIILCTAIASLYFLLMLSFSQVYYILYDNEKMPVIDIFEKSMDITDEKKTDIVIFNLPFILWSLAGIIVYTVAFNMNMPGWGILGLVILAIIIFLIIPYMLVANVNLYDELKKKTISKKTKKTK
ncbi:MAG: DUF975 family protein [Bacilli bacterium]|nr:DUF975 family protein [Bacilli bacterium]